MDKGLSERRALSVVRMSASALRYAPRPDRNVELRERIVSLAQRHKRYGVGMIYLKLRQEGLLVNYKRVERLYQEAKLQVRRRKRKKVAMGERQPLLRPTSANHVWSMDFVFDRTAEGRVIKCLTVVDDFSRECVDIAVDHGMGGEYVVRLLDQAAQFRGYPLAIRTDQGPEFTSRAFIAWAAARGVRHLLNDAGCPTQNAYIESFNGKFRDECLNEQWFETLVQARQEVARWRRDYNEVRPHSSLGRISPPSFAALHRQRAGDARQSPEIK